MNKAIRNYAVFYGFLMKRKIYQLIKKKKKSRMIE